MKLWYVLLLRKGHHDCQSRVKQENTEGVSEAWEGVPEAAVDNLVEMVPNCTPDAQRTLCRKTLGDLSPKQGLGNVDSECEENLLGGQLTIE